MRSPTPLSSRFFILQLESFKIMKYDQQLYVNEELGWERERERERGGGGGVGRATVQFSFICARPRVRTQYLCMQMALSEDTQQRKVENRKKYKLGKLLRDDQFISPYGKPISERD